MSGKDDYCDRCGARLDECTCVARRELDSALAEALGRGQSTRSFTVEELRDRASEFARRMAVAIREHVERAPACPHCAKCPALFLELMAAQRASADIVSSLDTLERLMRTGRFVVDSEALAQLAAASRRCHTALETIVERMAAIAGDAQAASAKREAAPDDVLDAAVAAWTANRHAKAAAGSLPPHFVDASGRTVTIWY
jgi:hypothetical protein